MREVKRSGNATGVCAHVLPKSYTPCISPVGGLKALDEIPDLIIPRCASAPSAISGGLIHGTKIKHLKSIMENGLKASKMHISLIDRLQEDGSIPGLSEPPEVLIYINEIKAAKEGIDFRFDHEKNTWYTRGVEGTLPAKFIQKILDNRPETRGRIIFQSLEDPELRAQALPPNAIQKAIHGSYWENFWSIAAIGLKPGHNPKDETRRLTAQTLPEKLIHACAVHERGEGEEGDRDPRAIPGLSRPADFKVVIDLQKAIEHGLKIYGSATGDAVFFDGPLPVECLKLEALYPKSLPRELRAEVLPDQIPVVDLSLPEKTVLEQLRHACEVVGFMQVVGHSVPHTVCTRLLDTARRFFALSKEVKERYRMDKGREVRGYFGKGAENVDGLLEDEKKGKGGNLKKNGKGKQDHKEGFDMRGSPDSQPPPTSECGRLFGATRSVEETDCEGFQNAVETYQRHVSSLARNLLALFAKLLGKETGFFQERTTEMLSTHRILHYWPLTDFENEVSIGEHTDYGLLTILLQDNTGGLQVLDQRSVAEGDEGEEKEKRWLACPPIDGAFVVNLGDMLAQWTSNRFKSTIHRVVNVSTTDRYSSPFFLEPDTHVRMDPADFPLPDGSISPSSSGDGPLPTSAEVLMRFYRRAGLIASPDGGA